MNDSGKDRPRRPVWALRWSAAIVVVLVLLLAPALGAAMAYVEGQAGRLIGAEESQATETELDLLVRVEQEGGRASLIRAIRQRVATEGLQRHKFYALRDPDGRIVAGNVSAWPDKLDDDAAWRRVLVRAEAASAFRAATRALDDGGALLVGRDADDFDRLRRRILAAVAIALAAVTLVCVAAGVGVTAFLVARVRRLSQVAAQFAGGDYAARMPQTRGHGPFQEIGGALNALFERVESLITGLTTVTDSLAHDLRTPLARTRRRLEEGALAPGPAAKQAAIEDALRETDRTIATFSALIDIARAEGGLSRAAMEPADLDALLRDSCDLFAPLAEERAIALVVASPGPSVILGHRALLQQAISNLLHNAIKYSPPGQTVDLRIERHGGTIDLVVADRGPGIPAEERAAATARFARGASADPEGLGLGLAIVEACARLHRGRLGLEDNSPGLRARLTLQSG